MDMYVPEEPADNDLKQLFEQHDVNNDGHMDVEEILHILAKDRAGQAEYLKDGMKSLVDLADSNRDGELSREEFTKKYNNLKDHEHITEWVRVRKHRHDDEL